MRPPLLRPGLLALLLFLAACHRGGRDTDEVAPQPEPESTEPVEIRVRSFNSQPIRMYVVRGGTHTRIGVIAEAAGQTFRLPQGFYGRGVAIHFVFIPVGGGARFVSETMTLQGGSYVEWTLAEQLRYSTVFVW